MGSQPRQSEYQFDLSGGNLALDFANTVSRRNIPERRSEHLGSYDDLVAFARQSKLITQHEDAELRARARKPVADGERLMRKALTFREAVYRAFSGLAAGKPVAATDLAQIKQFATEALSHRTLTRVNGKYRWEWTRDKTNEMERVLWPIAVAAADLLTSDDVASIRLCEAEDCDWLFLDNSRNHSRRWCDMKSCGNRAKARRHYQRAHDE
jgi:predicted RNA-binding Zn ribbon-like protein